MGITIIEQQTMQAIQAIPGQLNRIANALEGLVAIEREKNRFSELAPEKLDEEAQS